MKVALGFSYLLAVRAIYAGFGAFYTACLGLCDVHVSKGRLLHLHLHQAGPLIIVVIHSG